MPSCNSRVFPRNFRTPPPFLNQAPPPLYHLPPLFSVPFAFLNYSNNFNKRRKKETETRNLTRSSTLRFFMNGVVKPFIERRYTQTDLRRKAVGSSQLKVRYFPRHGETCPGLSALTFDPPRPRSSWHLFLAHGGVCGGRRD